VHAHSSEPLNGFGLPSLEMRTHEQGQQENKMAKIAQTNKVFGLLGY
jgi:hypothetical protein